MIRWFLIWEPWIIIDMDIFGCLTFLGQMMHNEQRKNQSKLTRNSKKQVKYEKWDNIWCTHSEVPQVIFCVKCCDGIRWKIMLIELKADLEPKHTNVTVWLFALSLPFDISNNQAKDCWDRYVCNYSIIQISQTVNNKWLRGIRFSRCMNCLTIGIRAKAALAST